MDDVRGDNLGPPHDTNKIKLGSFKSSENINDKGDGPYRGFGYLRMFAANIKTFRNFRFSFVEYLVNGCRYFPNILYLDTY